MKYLDFVVLLPPSALLLLPLLALLLKFPLLSFIPILLLALVTIPPPLEDAAAVVLTGILIAEEDVGVLKDELLDVEVLLVLELTLLFTFVAELDVMEELQTDEVTVFVFEAEVVLDLFVDVDENIELLFELDSELLETLLLKTGPVLKVVKLPLAAEVTELATVTVFGALLLFVENFVAEECGGQMVGVVGARVGVAVSLVRLEEDRLD